MNNAECKMEEREAHAEARRTQRGGRRSYGTWMEMKKSSEM